MERLLLLAVALLGLALRAWNLGQNGWGAEYYSAAVRSMAGSWHNFWFCAFDPRGFISVDKPPVALWIQVASTKLFGFNPWALLLPEAVEGVACVLLIHAIVRRSFGATAGLVAALFLAVTPVMVAVNRSNNMDSALVLVLLAAAWALLDAAGSARRSRLLLAMALVGVAFNTKMLAAFIVLPAFYATYFLAAPAPLARRIVDLALASAVLAIVSLAWVLAVELTPADARPYVGSSAASNSMVGLVVGHNALSRFALPEGSRPAQATPEPERDPDPDQVRPGTIVQRLFVRAPPGPVRLLHGQFAAQVTWWLPLALAGLLAAFGRMPLRGAVNPERCAVFFWSCWAATYFAVLSFAGGIVHYYYLAPAAPALAALAGIGCAALGRKLAAGGSAGAMPALVMVATASWQLFVEASAMGWSPATLATRGGWQGALHGTLVLGALAGAAVLLALRRPATPTKIAMPAYAVAIAALLVLPCAWALSNVIVPGQGVLPSADLHRLDPAVMASADPRVHGNFGRSVDTGPLVAYLAANRSGERFLLATTTTRIAAPIIVTSGEPVMAMGGFHGLDIAMTPAKLAREVASKNVRFVMLNDAALPSRRLGAEAALAPLDAWVREHGKQIPGALWRSASMPRGIALYDLAPGRR